MGSIDDLPTLDCWLNENTGSWWAWCPRCETWHYHSPEPGSRCAHCFTPGGYTSYNLRWDGVSVVTDQMRREAARRNRAAFRRNFGR